MATGVASPSAQGQEMTSTEMQAFSASSTLLPASSHAAPATTAIAITAGTKIPLTLSASFEMGALLEDASSTSATMRARVVSCPTRVARIFRKPVMLTEADITALPSSFVTGMLSPVSADWSTAELPSSTTPSTGTRSPGLSSTTSPVRISSAGMTRSSPSRSTVAVLGERSSSLAIAAPVLPLERSSKNLPTVTSVRIIAADSKYRLVR